MQTSRKLHHCSLQSNLSSMLIFRPTGKHAFSSRTFLLKQPYYKNSKSAPLSPTPPPRHNPRKVKSLAPQHRHPNSLNSGISLTILQSDCPSNTFFNNIHFPAGPEASRVDAAMSVCGCMCAEWASLPVCGSLALPNCRSPTH